MTSSSSEPSPVTASYLTTLISEGTVDEGVLHQYAEKGQLDIPDKDGRTPLMFACLKGLEDTVKFLLENGANPNSQCLKEGNTPMHYACIVEEWKEGDYLSGRYHGHEYNPSKWTAQKIGIIKLLLGSDALAIQDNLNGWSPPCVAAWYLLKGVLDFFLALDDAEIPLEEEVKATEILGVTQVIVDDEYYSRVSEDVSDCFSRAISLRKGASHPREQPKTSDLAACLSKLTLLEYRFEQELEAIKEYIHAFLVGDRLFPSDLKQKYLYSSLVTFGIELMWGRMMFKDGLQVLSCAIGFERLGELKLGTVVGNLAEKSAYEACREGKENTYLQHIRDMLYEYESVLNHVHIDSLSDRSEFLLGSFAELLFNEAAYCSTVDILRATLQAIEKLVRIIKARIRKENPDKYPKLSSLTWNVMYRLFYIYLDGRDYGIGTITLRRVTFVIRKILLFDRARSWERRYGNTSLHSVIFSLKTAEDPECLEDLALAFVRHGCPIDVVNEDGETAKDILDKLIAEELYDPESNPQLLTSVSPQSTVRTLEEIAIRAILHHNLIYQEILPPSLCEMIEGGLKDSDLVRNVRRSYFHEDFVSEEEQSGSDDNE